jgi:hypothetical protein
MLSTPNVQAQPCDLSHSSRSGRPQRYIFSVLHLSVHVARMVSGGRDKATTYGMQVCRNAITSYLLQDTSLFLQRCNCFSV